MIYSIIIAIATTGQLPENGNVLQAAPPNIINIDGITPTGPELDYEICINYLQTLPESLRSTTRFLSLYAIQPTRRQEVAVVTSMALNSLSWHHDITPPVYVPNSQDRVLVFNIQNYCRSDPKRKYNDIERWIKSWELMTYTDPYYLEPWVATDQAKLLYELTGSAGAVLRADFFNFYATLEDNQDTKDVIEGFYSFFLGLPEDEEALFKLLRVSLDNIEEDGTDRKAGVVTSGYKSDAIPVARNNRFLNRLPTTTSPHGGYLWFTQDYLNSKGQRNVTENHLSRDKDGGEYIWSLPNHLQGYFLTQKVKVNNKVVFKRITEVPIAVAIDNHFADRRVKIRSCTRCHVNGVNTYQDIIFGRIYAPAPPPGGLITPPDTTDYNLQIKIERAKQLFSLDQMSFARADQMNYKLSILRATGLQGGPEMDDSALKFAVMYHDVIENYEAEVTPEQAAWEFGAPSGINDYLVGTAGNPVSTTRGSLLDLTQGGTVKRDTFEEEFKNGKTLQNVRGNIVAKGAQLKYKFVVPADVAGDLVSVGLPPGSTWRVYALDKKGPGGVMKEFGPVTDVTLKEWIDKKLIFQNTQIKRDGDPEWVEAGKLIPGAFE